MKNQRLYPLIAETMYKSKDIERWGSGIKRIHDECVSCGVKVDFKRLKTGFTVVFYRPKWGESEETKTGGQTGGQNKIILSNKQKNILDILKKNPKISRKELADELSINTSAVQKHIIKLKETGYIKRIGPNFGGYWEVLQ